MSISFTRSRFERNKKRVEDNYNDPKCHTFEPSRKNPRKTIPRLDKLQLWEDCEVHEKFDETCIRRDILGNIVIKYITYNKNEDNRKFAFEYEHLISHADNGTTNTKNLCVLNAGINRKKKAVNLDRLTFSRTYEYCRENGIRFSTIVSELENDIHEACRKYNLLFIEQNGKYTLSKLTNTSYKPYNNEYYNINNKKNVIRRLMKKNKFTM